MRQSDILIPQGKLGKDLPDKEEDLFNIGHYPLFDMEFAVDILGDEAIVREIFKSFFKDNKKDINDIKEFFDNGNLKEVQRIAHKLKASAVYGTIRLHFALLFLERYLYAGHTRLVEKLYKQKFDVMHLTVKELEKIGLIAEFE